MKKGMKWFKKKLDDIEVNTTSLQNYDAIWMLNRVHELYDQLDEPEVTLNRAFEKVSEIYPMTKKEVCRHLERVVAHGGKVTYGEPEVLSQEWIDKNVVCVRGLGSVIEAEAVENLLMPKQGLPVIPQFVADWIEELKQDERPLYSAMSSLMNKTNHTWSVWKSANKNFSEIVAQAWLDGYTVAEEEPKYYVYLGDGQYLVSEDGLKEHYAKIRHEEDIGFSNYVLTFTEQEIKDYDLRFMAFAKPVEEMEK